MPSNPKNTVSTVIPGPRVRIHFPPAASRAAVVSSSSIHFRSYDQGTDERKPQPFASGQTGNRPLFASSGNPRLVRRLAAAVQPLKCPPTVSAHQPGSAGT
jgi:hypothetical protein